MPTGCVHANLIFSSGLHYTLFFEVLTLFRAFNKFFWSLVSYFISLYRYFVIFSSTFDHMPHTLECQILLYKINCGVHMEELKQQYKVVFAQFSNGCHCIGGQVGVWGLDEGGGGCAHTLFHTPTLFLAGSSSNLAKTTLYCSPSFSMACQVRKSHFQQELFKLLKWASAT